MTDEKKIEEIIVAYRFKAVSSSLTISSIQKLIETAKAEARKETTERILDAMSCSTHDFTLSGKEYNELRQQFCGEEV